MRTGRRASRAATEMGNIDAVARRGIPTMAALLCGDRPSFLGRGEGFLLVSEVPGDALERCFQDYLDRCRDRPKDVIDLTVKLAGLVAALHRGGMVHRDLYASHVFLDAAGDHPHLYLIDLARAFAPRWRRFRWRVKDIAQLKYSMPVAWVVEHWERFLDAYLAGQGVDRASFARAVGRKVDWMRRRAQRKENAKRS